MNDERPSAEPPEPREGEAEAAAPSRREAVRSAPRRVVRNRVRAVSDRACLRSRIPELARHRLDALRGLAPLCQLTGGRWRPRAGLIVCAGWRRFGDAEPRVLLGRGSRFDWVAYYSGIVAHGRAVGMRVWRVGRRLGDVGGQPDVRVAGLALGVAAVVALTVGAVRPVTRYYWVEAAVWGGGTVVALSIAVVAAAWLVRQRDEARGWLRLQGRVSQVLAGLTSPAAATNEILRALVEGLGIELAAAWRADRDDQLCRFVGMWAVPGRDVRRFRADSEQVEFERGQGMLGDAWNRGVPSVVMIRGGGFRRQDLLEELGLEAAVFVPIWQRGEVTGILELLTSRPDMFDATLLDLVGQIGHLIGVTYDRAEQAAILEASEERRRYVLASLLRAEEDAKARLASDLHDDTIQVMAAALISLERISNATKDGDLDRVRAAAQGATDILRHATDRARHLMFELRPQVLTEQGLEAATRVLLEDAAKVSGFSYALHADVRRYPRPIENLCYRVIQEAVSNITKHAHATTVDVLLGEQNGDILCEVSDDGVGFDVARALDRNRMRLHLGLESMRERVGVANGDFDIQTQPGEGSRLSFRVPMMAATDPLEQHV